MFWKRPLASWHAKFKIGTRFGTLARQLETLCTGYGMLARKNEKLTRSWHVGT